MSYVFITLICIGIVCGVYKLQWLLRRHNICREYRKLSVAELQAERAQLEQQLRDFFSLKSPNGGCMPDKMLRLKHRCLVEEFEYRNLSD